MKKTIINIVISLILFSLVFVPFWLPESVIFIKHTESVYQPGIEKLFSISLTIACILIGWSIYDISWKLANWWTRNQI